VGTGSQVWRWQCPVLHTLGCDWDGERSGLLRNSYIQGPLKEISNSKLKKKKRRKLAEELRLWRRRQKN
jgi:hypothetical protein